MAERDIHYKAILAKNADDQQLGALQVVEHKAFGAALTSPSLGFHSRSYEDVDRLVKWRDPERYMAVRRNPNLAVGHEYRADQAFWSPHIILAQEGETVIGGLVTAMNVSGASRLNRMFKRLTVARSYLHQATIAVHPDYQGQGIGTNLEAIGLAQHADHLKTTAYVWPELRGEVYDHLQALGFEETDIDEVHNPFGLPTGTIMQARLQAKIGDVEDALHSDPARAERIKVAMQNLDNQIPQLDALALSQMSHY